MAVGAYGKTCSLKNVCPETHSVYFEICCPEVTNDYRAMI